MATRAYTVRRGDLAFTVATSAVQTASLYEQTCSALAEVDAQLAEVGLDKRAILTAIVYIADMSRKPEMNRAWDEWADRENPPMRACLGVALEGNDLVEIVITAAAPPVA